jgi:endo-1,4-beta-xylanase
MKSVRFVVALCGAAAISIPGASLTIASAAEGDFLRAVAPESLHIGVAVAGGGHHVDQAYPDPFPNDAPYREVLATQFDSLTPENQLKWEFVHPARDEYNFAPADAIIDFAEENGQVVRGHTLLWHSQNPAWLDQGNFSAAELREILQDHITTVVGRYKGRIQQWDVANEILDDGGNLRTGQNIFLRVLGAGVVADAFRWAHEADPDAQLFLNDYGVETTNTKSTAALNLIKQLKADGVPIDGFGVQGHLNIGGGAPANMAANLKRFSDLGLFTAVTELDVSIPVQSGARPSASQLSQQADVYRQVLQACASVKGCDSLTVWGATDKYSWVPIFSSGNGAATIMWEDFQHKPAYDALLAGLKAARPSEPRETAAS